MPDVARCCEEVVPDWRTCDDEPDCLTCDELLPVWRVCEELPVLRCWTEPVCLVWEDEPDCLTCDEDERVWDAELLVWDAAEDLVCEDELLLCDAEEDDDLVWDDEPPFCVVVDVLRVCANISFSGAASKESAASEANAMFLISFITK